MLRANWIKPGFDMGTVCPMYQRSFSLSDLPCTARLYVSARGAYEAYLNGHRVGKSVLAPGWTKFDSRIQVQRLDVTALIKENNTILIQWSPGWYLSRIGRTPNPEGAVIAELVLNYSDGTSQTIITDESWMVSESPVRFCDIYDGEIYDATVRPVFLKHAVLARQDDKNLLCEQIGENITEHERLKPVALLHTPKGERVLDFGQNLAGYPEISLNAHAGDRVSFSFAEVLDKDGNFYNGNYRSAKCLFQYTCKEGEQTYKPSRTFYGFRYVRIDEYPEAEIDLNRFTAVVVHSDIKRTGWIETSDLMLNRLFENIIWGQKSNFIDVPTDCPQRDERLGWTGDAQIFIKAASYHFDVNRFFRKWLADLKDSQSETGAIPDIIPDVLNMHDGHAGWSDAVTVCPWQLYITYADADILRDMFPAMVRWVDHITEVTATSGLWTGQWQFGDWLELNAPYGKEKGDTRDDIVATAYYAYSTLLVCKAGKVLGEDVGRFERLYKTIVKTFRETFHNDFKTQTEYVLALHFDLTDDKKNTAKRLVELIHRQGDMLQTGFIGTPYLLHALSDNGYSELAYSLLLRREYPSWLYSVTKGATTMWEHWDGILPNGDLWSEHMNSYNHYAYGAVADWMFEVAGGIQTVEEKPGFEEIVFCPVATDQIDSFYAEIETKRGRIRSGWKHENGLVRYEITTPSDATARIAGREYRLTPGSYTF